MANPRGIERNMRVAILLALFVLVVIAPTVGIYAFSPFLFVWGLDPYQLAVLIGVMIAETIAIAALYFLALRARK